MADTTSEETPKDKANLVVLMAGAEPDEVLDMEKTAAEVENLRQSLQKYRNVVEHLVPGDELMFLSKRAREATLLADGS